MTRLFALPHLVVPDVGRVADNEVGEAILVRREQEVVAADALVGDGPCVVIIEPTFGERCGDGLPGELCVRR